MKLYMNILLFVILLSACVSTGQHKAARDKIPDLNLSENEFISKAGEYLDLPAPSDFIAIVDLYLEKYPEALKRLTDQFVAQQKNLIAFYDQQNDPDKARYFHNNLFAFGAIDEKESRAFYRKQAESYREKTSFATSKYLKTINDFFISHDEYKPVDKIARYDDLLVQIEVDLRYKSHSGLSRKNYPVFAGSGFIISQDQIVTAYHVIEDVFDETTSWYSITVKTAHRTIRDVKVIAWDSLTDIVVIELPEKVEMPYSFYTLLGDSSKLEKGYDVYCLGHHAGYSGTLTKGIVSATKRKAPESGSWIQVDAAIAPGASGGLLIGRDRLIYGMIVARFGNEQINFAVPSNSILKAIDRLRRGESIRHPWLGALLAPDIGEPGKILITDIFPSSPLVAIPVQPDDAIVSIDGKPVTSVETAQEIVDDLEPGNIVRLSIKNKQDEVHDYFVILATRPDFAGYNATRKYNEFATFYPYFGFRIDDTPVEIKNYNIKGEDYTINFYRVIEVKPGSILDAKGVVTGDKLGILADYYIDKTRYLDLFHISPNNPFKDRRDIFDAIYSLRKDKYDENIL